MDIKYLLPTDGSQPARAAEDYLERTVDPARAKVIVLGVNDASQVISGYELSSAERTEILDTERLLEEIQTKTEQRVTQAVERLEQIGFEVESTIVRGRPGVEICSVAEEHDVDSIVMGRRGASAITEALMGSVSSYVVHHSHQPVTLIPASGDE